MCRNVRVRTRCEGEADGCRVILWAPHSWEKQIGRVVVEAAPAAVVGWAVLAMARVKAAPNTADGCAICSKVTTTTTTAAVIATSVATSATCATADKAAAG